MSALLTRKFSFLNARLFKESISDTNENKYVFLAKMDSYGAGTIDTDPSTETLTPTNKRSEEVLLYNEILALKKILPANVSHVTRKHLWTSGTVYNQYSNTVDLSTYTDSDSGTDTDNPYFVVTGTDSAEYRNVYKCLDNNNGGQSTTEPTSTSDSGSQPARLADNYVWKYMLRIHEDDWDVFTGTSGTWMPLKTLTSTSSDHQWSIQKNAVDGSVNHITGIDHATLTASNDGHQVTLTGDGTGFTGTVVWNSTTDRYFNITNAGSGYTNVSEVKVNNTANANLSSVIAPRGGHGWNALTELSGHFIMIVVDFNGDEDANGYIFVGNDYRKVGILCTPAVRTTSLGETGSKDVIDLDTDTYVAGERADAIAKDQRVALTYNPASFSPGAGTFTENTLRDNGPDVTVTQANSDATGKIVHVDVGSDKLYILPDYPTTVFDHTNSLSATVIKNIEGNDTSITIVLVSGSVVDYDIIRDTGEIIYIDHLDAASSPPYWNVRQDGQTDKIDLVIEF